jgi:hypothetical protein
MMISVYHQQGIPSGVYNRRPLVVDPLMNQLYVAVGAISNLDTTSNTSAMIRRFDLNCKSSFVILFTCK